MESLNLYVDTCSWEDLLTEGAGDMHLQNLEFWIANGRVKLMTHEVILEEWRNRKEKRRAIVRQSLQANIRAAREVASIYVPPDLQADTVATDGLIARIDKLLAQAHVFHASLTVKALTADRLVARRPPFHTKVESGKDAFIIFSALEYFKEKKEPFIFVSSNKGEFAASESETPLIHSDLLDGFVGLDVQYHYQFGWAIKDLRSKLDISVVAPETSQTTGTEISVRIELDKTKSLIDQVLDYLEFMHRDIAFVPPRILINHYPFKLGGPASAYYSLFGVETDNQELISELAKIERDEKGRKILGYLTNDLVLKVFNRKSRLEVDVSYLNSETCDCATCQFLNLKFVGAFQKLSTHCENEFDWLKTAYAHYALGNYERAVSSMNSALVTAQANQSYSVVFICQYNLKKLSIFLDHYFGHPELRQIGAELAKLDLEQEQKRCRHANNDEVLALMLRDEFFTTAKDKIINLHYEILEQYYQSRSGGWSSNSRVWALKNYFAELICFVQGNKIVFDRFSDFYTLCDRVFEGMFASHAIRKERGSRLEAFDDWTLHQMLLYADADKLYTSFHRYRLKSIKYDGSKGKLFLGLLENLFTGNADIKSILSAHSEEGNSDFVARYNRIVCNGLTLFSFVELDDNVTSTMAEMIVGFLSTDDLLYHYNLKNVNRLLGRLAKRLPLPVLTSCFWVAMRNEKYHSEETVDVLCQLLQADNRKLEIADLDLEEIVGVLGKPDKENGVTAPAESLIYIYSSLDNEPSRKRLRDIIVNYLLVKLDFGYFYQAAIFNVVDFTMFSLDKLVSEVMPSDGRKSIGGALGLPTYRYEGVDDLINLLFKNNVDTTAELFAPIRGLHPYYTWLLDMENFKYENFDPWWIGEYRTKFYHKRAAGSLKTRQYLEALFRKEPNGDLEKVYYDIYIRRLWED